jgi:hypothetical protein
MTYPTETRTLTATLEDLRRRGFRQSFEPTGRGLRLPDGGRIYGAHELTIVEHHRFEGASDPGDMAVAYAIEAADGSRGVLVDAYGTYADPAIGEALRDIADGAERRRAAA